MAATAPRTGSDSEPLTRPVTRLLLGVGILCALVAALGIPARATDGARTTADEPQYLLTAASIADDLDLDISDEIDDHRHRPFHEIPIDQQTIPLDEDGRRVSPHDPLLPAMLALPMALGGWAAAKATLAVAAGATAALTTGLAIRRWGVRPRTAAIVGVAAFAGLPLAGFGSQVYPEMPAAHALLGAVALLPAPRSTPTATEIGRAVGSLALLVALPWLSVKYVPVALVAGLALAVRIRRRPRVLAALAAAALVAGATYLAAHQWIYGGWTAYASGDHFAATGEFSVVGTEVDLLGRSRRLVGLLVDRDFGIAAWSPFWLLLPVAVATGLRRRDLRLPLALLATTWLMATFVALTMHGWWVPGRQLVVGLPLAVLVIACWADGAVARVRTVAALGVVGFVNWAWLAVESSTGRRTLVVDAAETAAPAFRSVAALLPDGQRGSPVDTALLAVWAIVLVGVACRAGLTTSRGAPLRSGRGSSPSDRESATARRR